MPQQCNRDQARLPPGFPSRRLSRNRKKGPGPLSRGPRPAATAGGDRRHHGAGAPEVAQGAQPDSREPLNKSAQRWLTEHSKIKEAFRRKVGDLSREGDAEIRMLCKPRRARPEAPLCRVAALAKGYGHVLRAAPCRGTPLATQRCADLFRDSLATGCAGLLGRGTRGSCRTLRLTVGRQAPNGQQQGQHQCHEDHQRRRCKQIQRRRHTPEIQVVPD